MGHRSAVDMASYASLDAGLRWHLESNHYPPLPLALLPVCKRAIALANHGKGNNRVKLPEGTTHRKYGKEVPAFVIIEELHLSPWVSEEE